MFDIGVLEIGLITIVALLVIGPERLPAVARSVGFWVGKIKNFVTTVQQDFHREVTKAEELKTLLEEQSKIKDVHELIEQTVDETKKSVSVGADLLNEKIEVDSGEKPENKPLQSDKKTGLPSSKTEPEVKKQSNNH